MLTNSLRAVVFLIIIQTLGCSKSADKVSESTVPSCFNASAIMPAGAHISVDDFIDGKDGIYTLKKVAFMAKGTDNGFESSLSFESLPFAGSTPERPVFQSSALCKIINEGNNGHFPVPFQINRKDGVVLKDLQNSFNVNNNDDHIVASLTKPDPYTLVQRANVATKSDDLEIFMIDAKTFKIVFRLRNDPTDTSSDLLSVATYVLDANSSK